MPDSTALDAPARSIDAAALPRTPFAFIWYYLGGGLLPQLLAMLFITATATAVETAQPYALGELVNRLAGVVAVETGLLADPVFWFAALVVAWLLGFILSHFQSFLSLRMQMSMRVRIHDELFWYLHGHAPRYFLDQASGALVQKIRQGAVSAGAVVEYVLSSVVRFGVLLALTAVMIERQAPQLLWVFAAFIVVFVVVSYVMARRLRKYAKASAKASSDQAARLVDAVTNWDIVRSFARAVFERQSLAPFNDAEFDAVVKLRVVATTMRVVLHMLSVAFLAWLAWEAFVSTREGAMTVGGFTAVVSLAMLVAGHIRGLGDYLFAYFEHYGIVEEALGVLLAPHEIVDPPGAVPLRVSGGGIVIRDLAFAYNDGTPVFADFSLTIKPGERIGLVGPSGAGKSTLVKLLRRQFVMSGGQILIDGQDIANVTWDSLHETIAEVPQNPGMFHRTVRDNIRYSRPEASDEAVVEAAKLAHCHEFIAGRPKGYESIVGEKGMKLSGGEKQRVAIARAFLKNAPILVLDEATSSLDSEAEHLIQDGLLKLMEGRTVIAIAHRLSTIMHLDRIVVLDRGRIAEHGTHAELLAKDGIYARLWNRQAGGFI